MKKLAIFLLSIITLVNIYYTLSYYTFKDEKSDDYYEYSTYLNFYSFYGEDMIISWNKDFDGTWFYKTNIVPVGYKNIEEEGLRPLFYDGVTNGFFLENKYEYGEDFSFSDFYVIKVGNDLYYDTNALKSFVDTKKDVGSEDNE